ncbi:MAG: type VI secretion system contractile sheath large subunit [Niveispirillum sp.]|uniref:type VI secretion system contractile sheath large subunit n=1 Tax=Niveispirillum sp. TaxID=1917217 RepID=UPI003BA3E75C
MTDLQEAQSPGTAPAVETSILDSILDPINEEFEDQSLKSSARQGVAAFIAEMLKPEKKEEKINGKAVDALVNAIDAKISAQMNEILHHKDFQSLESAWRSLKFLVDRTDFRQNICIEVLNATKQELADDFEEAPELPKSTLYRRVYSADLGTLGGKPYGAIIGNFDFTHKANDIKLLQDIAQVAAVSHAPFIAATAPQMFGLKTFTELEHKQDVKDIMDGPQYDKWKAFRQSENARYVALTVPRFMLRLPYGPDTLPVKAFNCVEKAAGNSDEYLWGNTAFAFAARMTDSFAKSGWCSNVIGPRAGGTVDNLPLHTYEQGGRHRNMVPTEILLSERREVDLAESGFISLVMRKDSDNAVFFSAQSVQKPKNFGISEEGKQAEFNYKLSTQLPYMLIINRLAHYIKVIQREAIGKVTDRTVLEAELKRWLMQYVSNQENPGPDIVAKRPLRNALIQVTDVEGEPGWFRVQMSVTPHYKYQGAYFTLSLSGKLDTRK